MCAAAFADLSSGRSAGSGGEAWIALGSNLGDRSAILSRAVAMLSQRGVRPLKISHLYETLPESGAAEPPYLNAVVQARTDLPASDLLNVLAAVEGALGRPREQRAGPRTCDLDLLALDGLVLDDPPRLCLPHPRLHHRDFVLVPLCELDVHWRHPLLQETAGQLLARLPSTPGSVRLHGDLLPGPASSASAAGI